MILKKDCPACCHDSVLLAFQALRCMLSRSAKESREAATPPAARSQSRRPALLGMCAKAALKGVAMIAQPFAMAS